VGGILRRTSLDELPQLVNVLRGDMSLVGPRPALEYELEHYQERHFERFAVKPGMTGLWQVSGRNTIGFTDMLDLDVEYARTSGFLLDVKILAKTPVAAITGAA
jgi:lipopolysaccharide/colanic/teichoic acid biosynthesis glycosyltransferase